MNNNNPAIEYDICKKCGGNYIKLTHDHCLKCQNEEKALAEKGGEK